MNTQSIVLLNKWIVRTVLLTVLFALSILIIYSHNADQYITYAAPDKPTIVVDSKTMHVGQTFEIAVNLVHNTGLEAIVLQLDYDETVFTLMKVEKGNALRTLSYTTTNVDTNLGLSIRPFKMLWDGRAPDTSLGTMVVFTFNAARDAEKKDYNISISYEEKNTKSSYGVKVPVDISGGIVTLIGGLYNVNYVDYDGALLQASEFNEETTPAYAGNEPSRQETEAYSYIFNGWVHVANENSSLLIFHADYIAIPKIYTLNYYLEGQLHFTAETPYGEDISKLSVDDRQYFEFSGWCTDNRYKNKIKAGMKMPSYDLNLYGRYLFNHRMDEVDIPVIELVPSNDNGLIRIDVMLLSNTGISGMILTLDYDYVYLNLVEINRREALPLLQYETTNTSNGYDEIPFKLYWEGIVNDYSTGLIATLYFTPSNDIEDGLYYVTMTYTSGQDVSYIENGDLIYTDLVIQAAALIVEDGMLQWDDLDPDDEPCNNKCWIIIIIILIILLLIAIAICVYLMLFRYRYFKYVGECDYRFYIIKINKQYYFTVKRDEILIGKSKLYQFKTSCISAIFNLRKNLNRNAIINNDNSEYDFKFGELILQIDKSSDGKYRFSIRQEDNVMFVSEEFKDLSECKSNIESLKNATVFVYIKGLVE